MSCISEIWAGPAYNGDLKTGASSLLGPGELSEWRQRNCWIKRLEGTWEDANIMGDLKTDVQTLLGTRGRKLSGENSGDLKTGAQSLLGPGELMSCLARYR